MDQRYSDEIHLTILPATKSGMNPKSGMDPVRKHDAEQFPAPCRIGLDDRGFQGCEDHPLWYLFELGVAGRAQKQPGIS
jgi:hypothetical protein